MNSHPASALFPLLSGREFADLVDDIRANGQHEAIVLHPDGSILDGRNRYRACIEAGVEPRFRTWDGNGSATSYAISLNLRRRHLDESQRAMVAARARPLFAEEARERMEAGTLAQICARGKSSDEAAALVNVSPRSVESACKVLRQGTRELVEAVEQGTVAVSTAAVVAELSQPEQSEVIARGEAEILKAAKAIRERKAAKERRKKLAIVEHIRSESIALPAGPFRVIAIDPPWRYEVRAGDTSHRGQCPYPDLSLEEIKALPVADLAHQHAIVWLWTTNAFLQQAFECLDAWHFESKTVLTWVKDRMGVGNWLRGQTEHCILAVRGRPVVNLTNQSTVLLAPVREHSRKPDEFYALVESLCPGSKLEMFARQPRDGWVAWGAEVNAFGAA